jgi:hypothetical protein
MATIMKRTKLGFALAAPIFLAMIWILALSSSPLIESFGLARLIAWAAIASLISGYLITLFMIEVCTNSDK